MSNVERFKQTCIEEANGDQSEAFNIACQKAIQFWLRSSPGYAREAPGTMKSFSTKPRVEPVLLESERG